MSGEYLAPGVNETFDRVERFRNDLRNLKERWDNRLVLERCSLAELYINGRLEVVLHGDWHVGIDQYRWACRIKAGGAVCDGHPSCFGINGPDIDDGRGE